MSDPIPTRRAIEVCLARLPMSDDARRDLVCQLQATIRQGDRPDPDDAVALRAAIHAAIDDLSVIDPSFPKAALISRVRDARQRLRAAVAAL